MDAPAIAALWQHMFALDANAKLSVASRLALPLAVWFIYLVDRLLDTTQSLPLRITARHRFYYTHRNTAYLLTASAACALAAAVIRLPLAVLQDGLAVSLTVAVYLLLVHSMGGRWRRWLPKEAAVGFIFSIGTVLAPFARTADSRSLVFPALLFSLLCWLNCSAIETWETGTLRGPSAWIVHHIKAISLAFCVASFMLPTNHSGLSLALASIGFWIIAGKRREMDADALRVWIDVPLLAPILLMGLR